MEKKLIKIAVLGSGNGSNFEAITRHFENHANIEITCFSDNSDSYILERARSLGVEAIHLPFEENLEYFSAHNFDLYVLAGYMRVLPKKVVELGEFINIHPSLLPSFKGLNAIKQAYDFGSKITGVTIHYAEEDVDAGKIIAQTPVVIEADMNLAELEEAVHEAEHTLYPLVIESLLYDKIIAHQQKKTSNCSGGGCSGGCGSCGS